MTPDFETAAIRAVKTLIKYGIRTAPVSPFPIIKTIPGVLVVSFAEMSEKLGMERKSVVTMFGEANQDAVTHVMDCGGHIRYLVTYNQRLPLFMLQRALARELGHIVLGHDGTRTEDVRMAEALVFARHLLCPRPLIKSLQESDLPLTVEVLGNVTGCYERCLKGIQKTPGVHVPPELNRLVKEQFAGYVRNFLDCQAVLTDGDDSAIANFGTYMDGYED